MTTSSAEAAPIGIPVLVVSTNSILLPPVQEQATRCGQNRYLIKPFGLEEILERVREMVGAASAAFACCTVIPTAF